MYKDDYFNTTGEPAVVAAEYSVVNEKQNTVVLALFKARQSEMFTPNEVHEQLTAQGYDFLIWSVRRSITTLTKACKLVKTDVKIMGPHGHAVTKWMLNPALRDQQLKLIH